MCSRCTPRNRAIRAVVAAQWAAAVVLFCASGGSANPEFMCVCTDLIAALPCAVDVVGE